MTIKKPTKQQVIKFLHKNRELPLFILFALVLAHVGVTVTRWEYWATMFILVITNISAYLRGLDTGSDIARNVWKTAWEELFTKMIEEKKQRLVEMGETKKEKKFIS